MRTSYLPAWTIGTDCYTKVYEVVRRFGTKAAVIGGKTALAKGYDVLKAAVAGTDLELSAPIWFGGEASYENVDMLMAMPEVSGADMIFAFGGGRAIDTCKCAADKLGKPFFTFPTLSSNCAPCTALCIMYYPDGAARDNYYPQRCPNHTFINTAIIADSPVEYFWAGIGDAMSKEFESEFTSRKARETKNITNTPLMGVTVAPCTTVSLIENGAKAMEQVKAKTAGPELEEIAQTIIITTGIVSNLVVGSIQDPPYYFNSSLAHAFYYGSTVCEGAEKHLHGEVVALGVLVLLTLDGNIEMRDKLIDFYKSIELPVKMSDIELDLKDIDKLTDKASTFIEWGKAPCAVPYEITKEAFKQAILDTDAAGRR
ncbi:MAG: iron-containing alcohol dehydrogenase family protein [Eubacteriales bacterium]|nr:iron-containing alcohol dehydrogenase family protein [Eubacteriales bacterium]